MPRNLWQLPLQHFPYVLCGSFAPPSPWPPLPWCISEWFQAVGPRRDAAKARLVRLEASFLSELRGSLQRGKHSFEKIPPVTGRLQPVEQKFDPPSNNGC